MFLNCFSLSLFFPFFIVVVVAVGAVVPEKQDE